MPAEIGILAKLKVLRLSYNQLSSVPPMLGQLSELETLHINNNRVRGPQLLRALFCDALTMR